MSEHGTNQENKQLLVSHVSHKIPTIGVHCVNNSCCFVIFGSLLGAAFSLQWLVMKCCVTHHHTKITQWLVPKNLHNCPLERTWSAACNSQKLSAKFQSWLKNLGMNQMLILQFMLFILARACEDVGVRSLGPSNVTERHSGVTLDSAIAK